MISNGNDLSSLSVYPEHLPALEPRCDGSFCVQEGLKLSQPGGICAVNAGYVFSSTFCCIYFVYTSVAAANMLAWCFIYRLENVVVIATNHVLILPWVHEKFTVKITSQMLISVQFICR